MFSAVSLRSFEEAHVFERLFRVLRRGDVTVAPGTIHGVRAVMGTVYATGKERDGALRRRVARLAKRLRERRVVRVVTEAGFPFTDVLEQHGLRPPDRRKLFRAAAPELLRGYVAERRVASVAILCRRPTEEVFRAAAAIGEGAKSILLLADYEAETVAGLLRREFGLSVLLSKTHLAACDAALLYDFPAFVSEEELPASARCVDVSEHGIASTRALVTDAAFRPKDAMWDDAVARYPDLPYALFEAGVLPADAFFADFSPVGTGIGRQNHPFGC
ncbi:hypothetical protein LJC34_01805 [Oscillospiraceae bacterium OttesenSCG-928-G22]|nr:hypothetical protein [Oscillospiraceae bacterium OttesenSCG-928-G22]